MNIMHLIQAGKGLLYDSRSYTFRFGANVGIVLFLSKDGWVSASSNYAWQLDDINSRSYVLYSRRSK